MLETCLIGFVASSGACLYQARPISVRCVDMDSEATFQLKDKNEYFISLFSWLLRNVEPLVK